jgi:hypothetical protein
LKVGRKVLPEIISCYKAVEVLFSFRAKEEMLPQMAQIYTDKDIVRRIGHEWHELTRMKKIKTKGKNELNSEKKNSQNSRLF